MRDIAADFLELTAPVCPDDRASLRRAGDAFRCESCERAFPILLGRAVDLRPRGPSSSDRFTATYTEAYRAAFDEELSLKDTVAPWADPRRLQPEDIARKQRHVDWTLERLQTLSQTEGVVLCDVSAGPGYYTLGLASHFRLVVHCDLSGRALSHALHRAEERKASNIFFVRSDYFHLPFRHSLQRVICFDTLEAGPVHEQRLLAEIAETLAPNGRALVDFHNWWHNPVRRLGLLPDNFAGNRSYSQREVRSLLRSAGVSGALIAYHAEAPAPGLQYALLRLVLPATRHTAVLDGPPARSVANQ